MKGKKLKQRGVSLIELLIVILVIGSLTGIVFISTNPSKELKKRRNLQREIDIKEVAQSIHQIKYHSKDGSYPKTNDGSKIPNCEDESIPVSKLSNTLVPNYLTDIPTDPKDESDYQICLVKESQEDEKESDGSQENEDKEIDKKIKVSAPEAELSKEINIIR